jgi:c-di-GMP-binding flagellar brake protein YcgR
MSLGIVGPGTKLSIKGRRRNQAEVVYVSRVLKVLDDVNNIVAADRPVFSNEDMDMTKEIVYNVTTQTGKEVIVFKGHFEGYLAGSNQRYIALRLVGEACKTQRRQFYRHPCDIVMQYTIMDFEEGDELAEIFHAAGMTEKYAGNAIDISGGGMRFLSEKSQDLTHKIECTIPLDDLTVVVKAEVLEKTLRQSNDYQYRVSFVDVSPACRERIINYIFKKKREQAKTASI